MEIYKLGMVEGKFADLIWANQPITSRDLVALAEKELAWKKSTTYTMLRRLTEREIFRNDNGTVVALMSREEFYAAKSEAFVEESFSGSLPQFLTSFGSRKKLSEEELEKIQRFIEEHREQGGA